MGFSLLLAAVVLLLAVGVGLVRVALGPTHAERVMAAELFGTAGVALLLVLAEVESAPALRDVALVFALLASVVPVAFVKRGWMRDESPGPDED